MRSLPSVELLLILDFQILGEGVFIGVVDRLTSLLQALRDVVVGMNDIQPSTEPQHLEQETLILDQLPHLLPDNLGSVADPHVLVGGRHDALGEHEGVYLGVHLGRQKDCGRGHAEPVLHLVLAEHVEPLREHDGAVHDQLAEAKLLHDTLYE